MLNLEKSLAEFFRGIGVDFAECIEARGRRPGGHIGVAGKKHGAEALDLGPEPLGLGTEGLVIHEEQNGADRRTQRRFV